MLVEFALLRLIKVDVSVDRLMANCGAALFSEISSNLIRAPLLSC